VSDGAFCGYTIMNLTVVRCERNADIAVNLLRKEEIP